MKVTSEQRPSREALLTVELDADDAEPYIERAYKQVVNRLNIPGFRKGKAPRRIVEQMYGREYLANQALDFMLPEVTAKAVAQESLEMGGLPSISLEALDPIKYTATVPLVPEVDLGDLSRVNAPKERVRITKAQVEEAIQQLSENAAPWEPVDGKPQFDDLLNITAHGSYYSKDHDHDHDAIKSNKEDYVPRANSRLPVPGFAEKVISLNVGEETSFDIEVPEDYESTEVAGATVHFTVTIHSVKRRAKVAIDDELAKSLGDYENIEALRKKVREDMESEEARNVDARHKEEVVDKLLTQAAFEASPLLIDHEIDRYLQDFQEAMNTGRITLEYYQNYLAWAGKSAEEIREAARPAVEERVKRAFVLRKLVEDYAIEVDDDVLKEEIEQLAKSAGSDAKQVRSGLKEPSTRESFRRVVAERRAIDRLSEEAAVGPGAAKAAAPPADAPAAEQPKSKQSKARTPRRARAKKQ